MCYTILTCQKLIAAQAITSYLSVTDRSKEITIIMQVSAWLGEVLSFAIRRQQLTTVAYARGDGALSDINTCTK